MRVVNVAAATVLMLNAPVASPGHVVQTAPVTPRVQVVPAKPKALVCKTPDPGWVAWYPGQVAPYPLIGSTAEARLIYESPAGFVTLVLLKPNQDGSVSYVFAAVPLSNWCH
jgi:hypothetical protein